MVEGKSCWRTGLMVMTHTQKTVTLVSMILQSPISTESPGRVSFWPCENPVPVKGPTGWIFHGNEQRSDAIASNNACAVEINGWLFQGNCHTYRPPVKNNAHRPILSLRRMCKFFITNSGAIKIAKSVRTQGRGAKSKSTRRSPQCCGISGSQFARMGEHMKASANVKDVPP